MSELFVEEQVVIQAEVFTVWRILTESSYTCTWVRTFQPEFAHLESDWQLGSKVLWQTKDHTTLVDGTVTASEPPHHLSFSVHDVSGTFDAIYSENDGIFYSIETRPNGCCLCVRQGDFAPLGAKAKQFADLTSQSWTRSLPVIKRLAELV
jgi:hypothetical protein